MKLEGTNPLHRALEGFYGEHDPYPCYERPGRAAWRCPACCRGPWAPHRLTVALTEDGEPPECSNSCSEEDIWRRLNGTTRSGGGKRTAASSSESNRTHASNGASAHDRESTFTLDRESSFGDDGEDGLSLLYGLPLSLNSAGKKLKQVGKERRAAELASAYFGGVGVTLGDSFACPLPGHRGRASMWRDERTGLWKLCCWCAKRDGSEQTYWRVADVRAARGYGVVKWRSGYEATVWYRRLWQEVGLLSPASVTLPPLETPGDALAVMYAGLALLFALRWITNPGEPVTFARSFAPAWCEQSWTPTETYDRINKLSDAGVIKRAGTAPKSRSLLWLPGVAR